MRRESAILLTIILLLATPVVLTGCGDDDPTGPPSRPFCYELTVVDAAGAPMTGLRVSRTCRLEPVVPDVGSARHELRSPSKAEAPNYNLVPARPNPASTTAVVALEVLEPIDGRYLEMEILDWQGDAMIDPMEQGLDGVIGIEIHWGLVDPDRNPVPSGVYRAVFTVKERDSNLVLSEYETWFSVLTNGDPYRQTIGETDVDGTFTTTDKGLFPNLQGHQPQMFRDNDGVPGELFHFTDTVAVTVRSDPAPGTGGMAYWMTRDVVIGSGRTEQEWVFVPDDSVLVSIPVQSVLPPSAPTTVIVTR